MKSQNLSRCGQQQVATVISSGEASEDAGCASDATSTSPLARARVAAEFDAEGRAQPTPLPAGSRRRQRKFDPTWVECRPRMWRAEIRSARAHRLPPGVGWSDVERRVTTDWRTGELLEDTSEVGELLNKEFALRRLDKVRDIRIDVFLRDTREDQPNPHSIEWYHLKPHEKWEDIEYE